MGLEHAPPPDNSQPLGSLKAKTHWADSTRMAFLMPAVLLVLFLSVFPLIASLFTSLSRIRFVQGGIEINYSGLKNFEKLLLGSERRHLLGRIVDLSPGGWLLLGIFVAIMLYMLHQHLTSARFGKTTSMGFRFATLTYAAVLVFLYVCIVSGKKSPNMPVVIDTPFRTFLLFGGVGLAILAYLTRSFGLIIRIFIILVASALAYLVVVTLLSETGLPGTLVVTLFFVFVGVGVQYLLGLGLALLATQNLPGKRFFRVIFLLPMMITPVGIGFLFRMIVDTVKGPFSPVWVEVGLANFSWINDPHTARIAVMIGDVWQWTPFMFIILLAALEAVPTEPVEAAMVDGANRRQIFRHITLPFIVPVSTTLILIRLIESFKLIDMPQVLTNGGPGTATEPMTLHSYNLWRALDLGTSSAVAYILLFVATFLALVFVNIVRRRVMEAI